MKTILTSSLFIASFACMPGLASAQTFAGLGAPTLVPIGIRPYDVKSAYLNGDLLPDFVIANRGPVSGRTSGTVSVVLSDSSGAYANQQTLINPSLVEPESLAMKDLNGDGLMDLVVGNGSANNVVVFLGTTGSMPFDDTINVNSFDAGGQNMYPVASIDIGLIDDNDPIFDIISIGYSLNNTFQNLAFLKGLGAAGVGNGLFAPASFNSIPVGGNRFVRLGDLNGTGDGTLDAVLVNSRFTTLKVLRGDGVGNFAVAPHGDLVIDLSDLMMESAAIGDVNSDGRQDIVVTSLNPLSNNFGPAVSLVRNIGSLSTISFAAVQHFSIGAGPYSIALGDMNMDGSLDIVTTHRNEDTVDISVLLNNGLAHNSVSFGAPSVFTFPNGAGVSPRSIVLVDVDLDGDLDVVTTRKLDDETASSGANVMNGDLAIFKNLTINNTTVGDINGDGVVNGADLAILLVQWGSPCQANPCTADLNGDGNVDGSDLAFSSSTGPTAIRRQRWRRTTIWAT